MVWQELRSMGIKVPTALNPEMLPLRSASARLVHLSEVQFDYQGPARELAIGWALKPAGWLDWNHGASVVPPYYAWARITTPDTPSWARYIYTWFPELGENYGPAITIPYAGDYVTRGGAAVKFNIGSSDTWVWLTDVTAILEAGLPVDTASVMAEQFLLVIDTDAGVVEILASAPAVLAEARALEVRYELV